MGHRKHSQPRRGSLAYLPRGRAKSMEARIRTWPQEEGDQPKLLAHAGFKAGCIRIASIDDRDKTPNFGKQLVSLGTVVVTPPIVIIGVRGYSKDRYGIDSSFDVYAKELPKELPRLFTAKSDEKKVLNEQKNHLEELMKFLPLRQFYQDKQALIKKSRMFLR